MGDDDTLDESELPYRIVRDDEMLHPFEWDLDLAALIMRSLRWLGDDDEGGRQRNDEWRARCNDLAQAFEDYLALEGGHPYGVAPHPDLHTLGVDEQHRLVTAALERMKGLFEFDLFRRLGI